MQLDFLFGFIGWSIPWMVVYFLFATHLTFISITLYLHRHLAHRALYLHPGISHIFRFVLWLTTGMVTKEWVAIHRKHHAKTETVDDPHSPVIHGLPNILFKGVEYYRAAIEKETLSTYGQGTPDDWLERNVYTKHPIVGVGALAIVDVLLFGVVGVVIWALQMMWTPFWAAGVINGVGHALGYRNFECPDNAKNICPIGILACGEELHNNHHTYPNSARFAVKPWEFDLGWQYIRLLGLVNLAKPLHTGPVVEKVEGKHQIDMDTLWAVVNDRFRIMSEYAESVVKPIIQRERNRSENRHVKFMFRRADKALCTHDLVLHEQQINQIQQVTSRSPVLKVLYKLRVGLSELWAKRTGDADELLKAFRAWCAEAESTNLVEVKRFVADLRRLSIPQPT